MKKDYLIFFKNKKADAIIDIALFFVFIFAFGFASILFYPSMVAINDDIQKQPDFSTLSKASLNTNTIKYPVTVDNAFVFFIVLFIILIGVTSFFIETNPIFFVVAVVFFIMLLMVGGTLSAVHDEAKLDSDFANIATLYPKMDWLMSNLYAPILIAFATSAIILYTKRGG